MVDGSQPVHHGCQGLLHGKTFHRGKDQIRHQEGFGSLPRLLDQPYGPTHLFPIVARKKSHQDVGVQDQHHPAAR